MEATLGLAHFIPEPALTYRAELCPRKPQEAQRSGCCAEKRDQTYERNAEGGLKPRNLGSQVPVVVPRKVMEHMDKSLKEASMARVNVWPVIT